MTANADEKTKLHVKTDKIQEGMAAQWYLPTMDLSDWKDVEIQKPLELQGHFLDAKRYMPFKGGAWFAGDQTLVPLVDLHHSPEGCLCTRWHTSRT